MKILIGANLEQDLLDELKKAHPDAEIDFADSVEEIAAKLPGTEIVLARRFTEEMLAKADSLKFVQIPFAGVNSLPLQAMDERGILLANARIHGETISELVMGMMLSLARSFCEIRENQKQHQWIRVEQRMLMDHNLAIIGTGTIGLEIAKRAKAFGMRTIGFSRSGRANEYLDESYVTGELLKQVGRADYVVVACPLTDETLKLVDAEIFAAMKESAYILNIGRGPIIDEQAMIEALQQKRIAGAGLDVFEIEPLPADSPLWDMPNVLCFPHLAGNHEGSERRAGRIFVDNVANYRNGKTLRCAVDLKLGY